MSIRNRLGEFRKSVGPAISEFRFILHRVKQSPLSIFGSAIVVFFIVLALLAPILAPPMPGRDPYMVLRRGEKEGDPDYNQTPQPPVEGYPFGTTQGQYDLWYGCIWGTQTAFRVGIYVVVVSLIIGIAIGALAGYYGGVLDELMMRFTDIVLAFPGLLLAMAFFLAMPTRFTLFTLGGLNLTVNVTALDKVLIALIIVGWPSYTRVIRGEIMRIKTEDYVEAAKASGCSDFRLMIRHVLPNTVFPILIMASLDIGAIVLTAAALGFLGIGAQAGYADWGQMIALSRNWIVIEPGNPFKYWWVYNIPGVFIFTFVLGWNLLGDAFRDVLDPMIRRK